MVDPYSSASNYVSSTMSNAIERNTSDNVTNQNIDHCVPLKHGYIPLVLIVPGLVIIENVLVLLAIALYRKKLKHNNVYRYLASGLFANVVTSVLAFYHFLNYYYGFEWHEPNPWWAIRKGMTLTLSLILCGNIGLLIYGIEDNTYIISRISHCPLPSEKLSPTYKRRKANILIFAVWFLPITYGLLANTPWNCTYECSCTLSYESGKPICSEDRCSRLYTPMSKTYLLVVVCLWAIECVALSYFLWKSFCAIRRSDNEPMMLSNRSREMRSLSLRSTLSRYDASHRVVGVLFLLFFLCSAPIMVLFVLDFAIPEIHFSHALVNSLAPLTLLYGLLSPILVSQKLSGVRRAILMTATTLSSRRHKPSVGGEARKRYSNGVIMSISKENSATLPE